MNDDRPHQALFVSLATLAFLAVLRLMSLSFSSNDKLVWLTTYQTNKDLQPHILSRFEYKLAAMLPCFKRYYQRRHPPVLIHIDKLEISALGEAKLRLGSPTSTNSEGLRIWQLSSVALTNLQQNHFSPWRLSGTQSSLPDSDRIMATAIFDCPEVIWADSLGRHRPGVLNLIICRSK